RVALACAVGVRAQARLALRLLHDERDLRVRAELRLRARDALDGEVAGLLAVLHLAGLAEILGDRAARGLEVGVHLIGEALELDGRGRSRAQLRAGLGADLEVLREVE